MVDEFESAIRALRREVVAIEEDPRSASSLLGKAEHLVRMLKLRASASVLERAENALLRALSERCLRRTVLGATSKGPRLPQRERQRVAGDALSATRTGAVNGPIRQSLPVPKDGWTGGGKAEDSGCGRQSAAPRQLRRYLPRVDDTGARSPGHDMLASSAATGQSERAVRRDAHHGEKLVDAIPRVKDTYLDKPSELDALIKLLPQAREEVAAKADAGKKVMAKRARDVPPSKATVNKTS